MDPTVLDIDQQNVDRHAIAWVLRLLVIIWKLCILYWLPCQQWQYCPWISTVPYSLSCVLGTAVSASIPSSLVLICYCTAVFIPLQPYKISFFNVDIFIAHCYLFINWFEWNCYCRLWHYALRPSCSWCHVIIWRWTLTSLVFSLCFGCSTLTTCAKRMTKLANIIEFGTDCIPFTAARRCQLAKVAVLNP